MAITRVQQAQISGSLSYDDSLSIGSGLASKVNPSLADDLNSLRSLVKDIKGSANWYTATSQDLSKVYAAMHASGADAAFQGAVSSVGNASVGGQFYAAGAAGLSGSLAVAGIASFAQAANVGGNLAVTGASTLTGNVSMAGNLAVDGSLTLGDASSDTIVFNAKAASALDMNSNKIVSLAQASANGDALAWGQDAKIDDLSVSSQLWVAGAAGLSGSLAVAGAASFASTVSAVGQINASGGISAANVVSAGSGSFVGALSAASAAIVGTVSAASASLYGATLTGPLSVAGASSLASVSASGAVSVGGQLTVSGGSVINGGETVSGGLTVSSGGANINGATQLNSTLAVTGASTLASVGVTGAATVGGNLTVTGTSALNNNVTIAAGKSLTVGGALTVAGASSLSGGAIISNLAVPGTGSFTGALSGAGGLTISSGATSVQSFSATSAAISGNETVGGTLGVTGAISGGNGLTISSGASSVQALTAAGLVDAKASMYVTGALGVTGAISAASMSLSGNETVGGNLSVVGSSTLGALSAGASTLSSLTVTGDAVVNGNLQVQGVMTYIETTNLKVRDAFIHIATGSGGSDDKGIVLHSGGAYDDLIMGQNAHDGDFIFAHASVDTHVDGDNAIELAGADLAPIWMSQVKLGAKQGSLSGSISVSGSDLIIAADQANHLKLQAGSEAFSFAASGDQAAFEAQFGAVSIVSALVSAASGGNFKQDAIVPGAKAAGANIDFSAVGSLRSAEIATDATKKLAMDVYLNGVRLAYGDDYSIPDVSHVALQMAIYHDDRLFIVLHNAA